MVTLDLHLYDQVQIGSHETEGVCPLDAYRGQLLPSVYTKPNLHMTDCRIKKRFFDFFYNFFLYYCHL